MLKNAYFKISVVDETVEVSGDITSDTTWVNTKTYNLNGVVFVKNGATLTVEPGTIITGEPGSQPASSLFVTTTGRLVAAGTRSRPITFTSKLPFGERNAGDWGGLVLLGAAPVNWPTGFGNIEGLPPSDDTEYGGDDPTHDCGTLTYVRVEFAGAEFAPNDEINAITFGGCGSDTVAHHLQAKYGLDDLFEWFGGTMDASYLVGTYGQDDFLDIQIGWTGRLQHAVCVAGVDQQGNRGIESDNNEDDYAATPVTEPQVYNVTMVGAGDTYTEGFDEGTGVAGAYFRRGSGGSYNNVLLYNWVNTGFVVLDQESVDNGALSVNGLLMWNNGLMSGRMNTMADQVLDPLGSKDNLGPEFLPAQANVRIADPDLVRPPAVERPRLQDPRGGRAHLPRQLDPAPGRRFPSISPPTISAPSVTRDGTRSGFSITLKEKWDLRNFVVGQWSVVSGQPGPPPPGRADHLREKQADPDGVSGARKGSGSPRPLASCVLVSPFVCLRG